MRASALAAFVPFSTPLEGMLTKMYVDDENLVTTGMGNLIDPISAALGLPWKNDADGSEATQDEITAAWNAVKNADVAGSGGGTQGGLTTIHLNQSDVDSLIDSKVTSNEALLRQRVTNYDSLPADAQLGLAAWAWAVGAEANFPKFLAALSSDPPDFQTAASESTISNGTAARNAATNQLFLNAAAAQANGWDYDSLVWPNTSPAPSNLVSRGIASIRNELSDFSATTAGKVVLGAILLAGLGTSVALIAPQLGLRLSGKAALSWLLA